MGVSAPRGPARKEIIHATCDQDVDPDGRFSGRVRSGGCSDASRTGRWTDSDVLKESLSSIAEGQGHIGDLCVTGVA